MIAFHAYKNPQHCVFIPTVSATLGSCEKCEEVHAVMIALDFLIWGVGVSITFNPPPADPHA